MQKVAGWLPVSCNIEKLRKFAQRRHSICSLFMLAAYLEHTFCHANLHANLWRPSLQKYVFLTLLYLARMLLMLWTPSCELK
jgi:hypothetical protein